MELKNARLAIDRFRKYVIQQSRNNLTKQKHNVNKSLYNSLTSEVVSDKNYFLIGFNMNIYGKFLDKGVKGANPSLVKNGKQKAPNSEYRFKNKQPPVKPLAEWAKKKNIRLRDEKGQYKKGNYKTIGFILSRRIFAQGIKPSLFFTKPFEDGLKKYISKDIMNGFGGDIDTIIDNSLKDL